MKVDKEKLLEYRTKELRILRTLNKIIGSTENIDIFLSKVGNIIKREIKGRYIFFVLKQDNGFEVRHYEAGNREIREDFKELLLLMANDVIRRAGFLLINNTRKHKRLRNFKIANVLIVSLMLYSDVLGAIIIMQKQEGFTRYDLRLANSIANQIAIALDQINVKRKLEEKERKVAELYSKLYKKEAKKAITDPLTKLYNKGFFIEKLEQFVKEKKKISLIMFDLDHFKNYNDLYGHLEGDNLLVVASEKIRNVFKEYNVEVYACRYGGEEFAIIINANLDLATEIAERIRQEIEELYYERKAKRLVTASFGVGQIKAGEKIKQFIDRVDKLLYHAKQLGRNLVYRE